MNRLKTFVNWIKSKFSPRNYYEGAQRFSKDRSWLPEQNPQSARFDVDSLTLTELIRKTRYFVKNNEVIDRIADIFEQYTVGSCGIEIFPATSDTDFNSRVKEAWSEFCEGPDATSLKSYAALNVEGAHTLVVDNNYLILKGFAEVLPKVVGKPGFRPTVQLIEIHRLSTPPAQAAQEGKTIINGIQIDPKGKPIGYWIRDDINEDRFTYRTSSEVKHVYKSTRPGQYFGVPLAAPALNTIHDYSDLDILQMRKAKDAARRSFFVTTEAGDEPDIEDKVRNGVKFTTQDSKGNDVEKTRLTLLNKVLGGETAFGKPGEGVSQIISNSPSVSEQWYFNKLETRICAAYGLSRMLVFPESVQGTVARGDLAITTATLKGWCAVQAEGWKDAYLFWLEWAIKNDPRCKNPPKDYRKSEYRAPRGPDVDVGWNSQAVLNELDAGVRTIQDIYSELSQNWEAKFEQRGQAWAKAIEIGKKYGVPPERIMKPPDSILKKEQAEQAALSRNDSAITDRFENRHIFNSQ